VTLVGKASANSDHIFTNCIRPGARRIGSAHL